VSGLDGWIRTPLSPQSLFLFPTPHPPPSPPWRTHSVGFDGAFNYFKLQRAVSYLRYSSPPIPFIATNRDVTYPDAHQLVPGGGTLVAAVEAGAGRAPDVVAGKPSQGLVSLVTSATGLNPARTCMVGDRLDTDIAFGNLGGFKTLLVLTGIASEASLVGAVDSEIPGFLVDSLGDLEGFGVGKD
jgi:ribonucleotide monophosphatase NagD (HAD superfamily)